MIGKNDPFVQVMRTTNFSSHVEDYADKVRASYDKMTLLVIESRLKELTNTVESQIKINSTIKSLDNSKIYDSLSNKIKELCDSLDNKYTSRKFNEETSQAPPPPAKAAEEKKEEPPVTADI